MKVLSEWVALLVLLSAHVLANTEKTIFLAPATINFPSLGPSIENLKLDVLSPDQKAIRKALPVTFPTTDSPTGVDSWYFLRALNTGQRYEVRACWAATQPTVFDIDTFTPSQVFETPKLIQSLAQYSEQQTQSPIVPGKFTSNADGDQESVLFLRISSAADFYTANETLMRHPPPVNVDIILDPFLLNVFPQSLLPTAAYLVLLAIGAYFISERVWSYISTGASVSKEHPE